MVRADRAQGWLLSGSLGGVFVGLVTALRASEEWAELPDGTGLCTRLRAPLREVWPGVPGLVRAVWEWRGTRRASSPRVGDVVRL